ncbi:MAG: tetratricopeptide repeat protein [Myxococcaceae bacterium]
MSTNTAADFGFTEEQLEVLRSNAFDLVDANEIEGAVHLFRGLAELQPFEAAIHAALGFALATQGKFEEALLSYDTALSIESKHPLALVNRGDLRCQRGDLNGIEDLQAAASQKSPVQQRAAALLARYRG